MKSNKVNLARSYALESLYSIEMENMSEEESELIFKQWKATADRKELSEAKADYRKKNIFEVLKKDQHQKAVMSSYLSMGTGAVIGGVVGNRLASLVLNKLDSKIYYLESKKHQLNPVEYKQLKSFKIKRKLILAGGTIAGASLGGYGGKLILNNYMKKKSAKDQKAIWNTNLDE